MKKRPNTIRKMQRRTRTRRQEEAFQNAFKAILGQWGLRDHFRRDYSAEDRRWTSWCAKMKAGKKPPVTMSDAAKGTSHAAAVASEIQVILRDTARTSVPTITPDDWWRWYVPALGAMETLVGRPACNRAAPKANTPSARVASELDALFELLAKAHVDIWHGVLASRSRIDTGLFSFRGNLLSRSVLEIDYTPAQVRQLTLDGHTRPVYRSGVVASLQPWEPHAVWNDWPSSKLPDSDRESVYPVYVQGHALRRLEERFDFPDWNWAFHFHLGESLREPVLFQGQRPGVYLVEYRIHGKRFGYLVAERLSDLILVRTFKFLTMAGTPEGARLQQRSRLRRPDLAYHRLDRWSTFAFSDLGLDRGLVELFAECGCGHLLVPPELWEGVEPAMKVSEALRQYIGMPPRAGDEAAGWHALRTDRSP